MDCPRYSTASIKPFRRVTRPKSEEVDAGGVNGGRR